MPFDTDYTPAKGGLSSQLLADASARRDASQKAVDPSQDPRIVTRGSFSRNRLKANSKSKRAPTSDPALSGLLEEFFFDWFQVTLPNKEGKAVCQVGGADEVRAIEAAFDWCVKQGLHPGRPTCGHNGYRAALPWLRNADSSEVVCRINTGSSSGIMPNVMITGGHGVCAELAPRLQEAFPGARLSRADAALDWSQDGLWDSLLGMAKTLARSNAKLGGVRMIESEQGRTFYLGSRKSTVSLRVYEKDKERAARGVIDAADVDPNLIRIEWTFRPQSKSKVGMSGKTPGDMIRTSVWARDFMARAAKIMAVTDRVERINKEDVAREVTERTLEASARHGVMQYGKTFARLAAATIVERDYDGRYDTTVLASEDVQAEAVQIFERFLMETGAACAVLEEERLDRAIDPDEWRASYVHELLEIPDRVMRDAEIYQGRLAVIAYKRGCDVSQHSGV